MKHSKKSPALLVNPIVKVSRCVSTNKVLLNLVVRPNKELIQNLESQTKSGAQEVVFLLDNSNSMESVYDKLKEGLIKGIKGLDSKTKFTVILFGTKAEMLCERVDVGSEIAVKEALTKIEECGLGGWTNLPEGLEETGKILSGIKNLDKVTFVLLTDGDPRLSAHNHLREESLEQLKNIISELGHFPRSIVVGTGDGYNEGFIRKVNELVDSPYVHLKQEEDELENFFSKYVDLSSTKYGKFEVLFKEDKMRAEFRPVLSESLNVRFDSNDEISLGFVELDIDMLDSSADLLLVVTCQMKNLKGEDELVKLPIRIPKHEVKFEPGVWKQFLLEKCNDIKKDESVDKIKQLKSLLKKASFLGGEARDITGTIRLVIRQLDPNLGEDELLNERELGSALDVITNGGKVFRSDSHLQIKSFDNIRRAVERLEDLPLSDESDSDNEDGGRERFFPSQITSFDMFAAESAEEVQNNLNWLRPGSVSQVVSLNGPSFLEKVYLDLRQGALYEMTYDVHVKYCDEEDVEKTSEEWQKRARKGQILVLKSVASKINSSDAWYICHKKSSRKQKLQPIKTRSELGKFLSGKNFKQVRKLLPDLERHSRAFLGLPVDKHRGNNKEKFTHDKMALMIKEIFRRIDQIFPVENRKEEKVRRIAIEKELRTKKSGRSGLGSEALPTMGEYIRAKAGFFAQVSFAATYLMAFFAYKNKLPFVGAKLYHHTATAINRRFHTFSLYECSIGRKDCLFLIDSFYGMAWNLADHTQAKKASKFYEDRGYPLLLLDLYRHDARFAKYKLRDVIKKVVAVPKMLLDRVPEDKHDEFEHEHVCPITGELISHPVKVKVSGKTYEKEALGRWRKECKDNGRDFTDPLTRHIIVEEPEIDEEMRHEIWDLANEHAILGSNVIVDVKGYTEEYAKKMEHTYFVLENMRAYEQIRSKLQKLKDPKFDKLLKCVETMRERRPKRLIYFTKTLELFYLVFVEKRHVELAKLMILINDPHFNEFSKIELMKEARSLHLKYKSIDGFFAKSEFNLKQKRKPRVLKRKAPSRNGWDMKIEIKERRCHIERFRKNMFKAMEKIRAKIRSNSPKNKMCQHKVAWVKTVGRNELFSRAQTNILRDLLEKLETVFDGFNDAIKRSVRVEDVARHVNNGIERMQYRVTQHCQFLNDLIKKMAHKKGLQGLISEKKSDPLPSLLSSNSSLFAWNHWGWPNLRCLHDGENMLKKYGKFKLKESELEAFGKWLEKGAGTEESCLLHEILQSFPKPIVFKKKQEERNKNEEEEMEGETSDDENNVEEKEEPVKLVETVVDLSEESDDDEDVLDGDGSNQPFIM